MNTRINNFLKDWFIGIYLTLMSSIVIIMYFGFPSLQPKIQEALPYDTVYYLFSLVLLCFSLTYFATPLSKILAKNKKVQQWYINHKAKQWRDNK